MTTETTMPPRPDVTQVLEDVKSTSDAVRSGGWLSSDLGASPGLDVLSSAASPLSELASSGLGFITEFVSFLEEPLQQLQGDPNAISSGAQGFQDAGQEVAKTAESYQQSTGPETSEWSGDSAQAYMQTGTELVGSLTALGEASKALGAATAGAGEAVASTHAEVSVLIQEATGKIIMILNQALAAAQATFGASIAAAIPQAVQVAVEYGGRIAEKMQKLLGSAQELMTHVQSTAGAVTKVTGLMSQICEQFQQPGDSSGGTQASTTGGESSAEGAGAGVDSPSALGTSSVSSAETSAQGFGAGAGSSSALGTAAVSSAEPPAQGGGIGAGAGLGAAAMRSGQMAAQGSGVGAGSPSAMGAAAMPSGQTGAKASGSQSQQSPSARAAAAEESVPLAEDWGYPPRDERQENPHT